MKKLKKFIALSSARKRLLLEAVLLLAFARVLIVFLPFKRYAHRLGFRQEETPDAALSEQSASTTQEVCWAVAMATGRLPWNMVCFPQAMAGKWMLARRNIASTLYLGVAREDGNLTAHAWLRAGDAIVTGRKGMERFAVVSVFS